ncbi:hypothetical protein EDD29_4795 [Actinocorallia herbida]|uniref:Uncharacterized protein n=1 Tax=Actinocorallia herbida TaxID=58109 RepID=A0A3N1D112_9ACTN|nr:hypothetical protein [Actinocorallia herbida]ROO87201.1 hypothetical protein EDD29_4795 [Actinocorallia herbida]
MGHGGLTVDPEQAPAALAVPWPYLAAVSAATVRPARRPSVTILREL